MRNLDDGILVAANEPLLDFMPLMADIPFYRLVLTGSRINGIVTRSDLLKLPVRLLGFAMVTNLELMMQEVIQHQLPDDQVWMALLSNNRREKVLDKQADYQKRRLDPSLLELTEFADKRTIVKKHLKLPAEFKTDLEKVEKMRNSIAHAGNYANNEAELHAFIQNMKIAHRWVEDLSKFLLQ
jgi:hypothetical protein